MADSSISSSPSLVILGAGAPYAGEEPVAVRRLRSGISALDWIFNACRSCESETIFVAGYHAETIRRYYPALQIVENKQWEMTGSCASLLMAPIPEDVPALICYGDILFRRQAVRTLAESDADIVVAWDSSLASQQRSDKYQESNNLEKIITDDCESALRLGTDIPTEWADGIFIGLVRLSPKAIKWIKDKKLIIPESLKKRHLSDLIEYMRTAGFDVKAKDIGKDWAEFNEPRDIAKFILGTKAETLSRLRNIVCHSVIQKQFLFNVSEWRQGEKDICATILALFGNKKLVVRSSALNEDTFYSSNAGGYLSVLNIQSETELKIAVNNVIKSYKSKCDEDQILVQPMVADVIMSGVAFTRSLEHSAPYYTINYQLGSDTEAITSGSSIKHLTLIARRDLRLDHACIDPRLSSLLKAIREIEELLGYDKLDIEFAIDSLERVHIFQVRPIAVTSDDSEFGDTSYFDELQAAKNTWDSLEIAAPHLPQNISAVYGIMPDWNPAEIIGTSPRSLATSLYKYLILDDTWALQRFQYGYRDVRPQPLLVEFCGHPYVDVRASLASFLPASISDELAYKLLSFYVEKLKKFPELHDKLEFEILPTCISPGFDAWEEILYTEACLEEHEVFALKTGLLDITTNAFNRVQNDLDMLVQLENRFNVIKASNSLQPLEAARILLDDCKNLGTLPFAHLARGAFISMTMLRDAVASNVISKEAKDCFLSTIRTVTHRLNDDAHAVANRQLTFEEFRSRYGHLRPGTYEITSQRYDADPTKYLWPIVNNAALPQPDSRVRWDSERDSFFKELEKIGLPSEPQGVEAFMRQTIEGREYAKFVFTRNLSLALEKLADAGKEHDLSRSSLSHLTIQDIMSLRFSPARSQAPKSLILKSELNESINRLSASIRLPALMTSKDCFDSFTLGSDLPNFIGSLSVTAEIAVLNDTRLEDQLSISGKIVVIEKADPGFDWIFCNGIKGLITLYGGANSHMAIRAAEFSIPAAIGVGEKRFYEITNARIVELSPANNILRRIS